MHAVQQRRASDRIVSGSTDRSISPPSHNGTPGLPPNHNIAPQHVFDGVSLADTAYQSSSLPGFTLRHPSPSPSSVNGSHIEPHQPYGDLAGSNGHLKTRVSELEVINDLFRGRVSELEQSEQESRRQEGLAREAASRYKADLETALSRESDLKRRLQEVEAELQTYKTQEQPQKRARLSDAAKESNGPSSPTVAAAAEAST